MKKVRLLGIILAAAIMLTGVGYALWSEDITIASKAETGEVDVEILNCGFGAIPLTTMPGLHAGFWNGDNEEYMDVGNAALSDAEGKGEGYDTITVNVKNLYPKAKYLVSFKIKNTGDFPVRLADLTFTPAVDTPANDMFDELIGSVTLYQYRSGSLTPINSITVNDTPFASLGTAVKNAATAANMVLMPGDEVWSGSADMAYTGLVVTIPNYTGDTREKSVADFKLTFKWEQCDVTVYPIV